MKRFFLAMFFMLLAPAAITIKAKIDEAPGTVGAIQDFLIGINIGLAHGLANKIIESQYAKNKTPRRAHLCTWGATEFAASRYAPLIKKHQINDEPAYQFANQKYRAVLWGRGIGQCVTESIQISEARAELRLNLSLLASLALYFADYAWPSDKPTEPLEIDSVHIASQP